MIPPTTCFRPMRVTDHAAMYRRGKRIIRARDFYFEYVLGPFRWGTFPFRHPRLWWMARRIDWHFRFGLPMPVVVGYNAIEA